MTPKAELLKIDQNLFCVGVHLDYLRLFISHPIVFTVSFILITIYDDGIYLWVKVNLWESATMRKVGKYIAGLSRNFLSETAQQLFRLFSFKLPLWKHKFKRHVD